MSVEKEGASKSFNGVVDAFCENKVYQIVLNQPDSRNPLSREMMDGLGQALQDGIEHPTARVIVFSARGRAFCAGGNLSNVADRLAEPAGPDGRDPLAVNNRVYGYLLECIVKCPKPTVAMVQGAAMGGGAGLACATDIVIANQRSFFGFPEARIGLVPAQILPFVVARIGLRHARRMFLTGERASAVQAHHIGIVDYLEDSSEMFKARLHQVCQMLILAGPHALSTTKVLLNNVFEMDRWYEQGLSAFLDESAEHFAVQFRGEAQEGIAAAREKRQPNW